MRRPGLRQERDKDCFANDKKSLELKQKITQVHLHRQNRLTEQAILENKQTGGLKGLTQNGASALAALLGLMT